MFRSRVSRPGRLAPRLTCLLMAIHHRMAGRLRLMVRLMACRLMVVRLQIRRMRLNRWVHRIRWGLIRRCGLR